MDSVLVRIQVLMKEGLAKRNDVTRYLLNSSK